MSTWWLYCFECTILLIVYAQAQNKGLIGVNWGTLLSHPLYAPDVVEMLKANNVGRVKLFEADPAIMKALGGSGLEVMVGIPNEMLQMLASDLDKANDWVRKNVSLYYSRSKKTRVNIKYVAVGNEPFLQAYNGTYGAVTLPAMKNVQAALSQEKLSTDIKVTVPLNADVLQAVPPDFLPSTGMFRDDIRQAMLDIVQFLSSINAPFVINLYPFISLEQDPNFPIEFAFLDGTGQIVDGPNTYTNVFDASFDMLVTALTRAGFGNMEIIVGEAGWPTDAHTYANPSNARRFNQALVNKILRGEGTPLKPQNVLHAYIFSLFDEDKKSIAPGPFERHWGIFEYDGQPKYPLDTTGSNNPNAMLKNVSRVEYLPARYCVLKPGRPVPQDQEDFACSVADCTSLVDGGSCCFLTPEQKASYAFNSYYQYNNQSSTSCDFQGNAIPTSEDPSTQTCRFNRQIRVKTSSVGTREVNLVLVGLMWITLAFI